MGFRSLLILLYLSIATDFYGQQAAPTPTYQLPVVGIVEGSRGSLQGVKVEIIRNGKPYNNFLTDVAGAFSFSLPINSDYMIVLSKEGYATKKFAISTLGVPAERMESPFGTLEVNVGLYEKIEGVDYSILNQPANKFNYNPGKENFEYDKAYLQQMQSAMAALQAQMEAALKRVKEMEANYKNFLKEGDKAFNKKDWAGAKANYQKALGMKPAENYPKDQIAQIDKIIAEQEALNKKKDEEAKKAAEEAARKKAEEDLNNKYLAALKKGDDAFAKKDYNTAKAGFTEALGVKPGEQLPKDRLAAVEKAIADEAKAKADADSKAKAEAELNDKYNAAIAKGDNAFKSKDWNIAKAGYIEASGLKPAEAYPKSQIAAIDKAIADDARAKADADAKAKAEAELKARYDAAIAKGDAAFKGKDWNGARTAYNDALGLKPAEAYPKAQLAAIEKAMADDAKAKADAESKAKAEAELKAKYDAAIAKGDAAFKAKDWPNAKSAYNEALGLKPAEAYPKSQIAVIEKAIADDAAAKAKAEADAKAKADAEAKAKAEAELKAKYDAALARADAAFKSKDWSAAKSGYTEALSIRPTEKYPKDQIAAIEKAISDDAAAKAKAEAEAKAKAEADAKAKSESELKAKYDAAIAKGDAAFKSKSWDNAKLGYNEALGYKPAEKYPKDQLAAIEKAIADEAAARAKAEADAKAKAEADAKLKGEAELKAKYDAALAKGDGAFKAKDWSNAKLAYNEALGYRAAEKYPKDQLAAIEKAIAADAEAKAKADAEAKAKAEADAKLKGEAELKAKYDAAISKGDAAFKSKNWETAKTAYNEALGYRAGEKYPKDQLAAIETAMAADAAAKAKAEADARAKAEADARLKGEAEVKARYDAAIASGDAAFKAKNWEAAKSAYTDALGFKPAEKYPKDQIAAVDKAISAEAAAKAKAEADAKSKTDADSKSKAEAELKAKYDAAILKGDAALKGKEYSNAKRDYNEALSYRPNEKYPKDQLAAIDKAIADEKAKAAAEAKRQAEEEAKRKAAEDAKKKTVVLDPKEQRYQEAIKNANNFFGAKRYRDAKKYYEEALNHKGGDAFAMGRLAECEKFINSDSNQSVDDRIKQLLAKYQPGVTQEEIIGTGVVITQRVVVKDNMAWVYQRKAFSWGGVSYFRDGTPITESTFELETKP